MRTKAIRGFLFGAAALSLALLLVSYARLVRTVEIAAREAGVIDRA
jgi:hypothetical protein